ncbi:MAG: hypothetical protein E6G57_00720 [Actinobacteria bacterium]|nr:MAG: hypothetical protein E6G57_00720 [Actinomycetota bacterium]
MRSMGLRSTTGVTAATTAGVRPLAAIYETARLRLIELVERFDGGPEVAGATPVPACPGWTVRDVLAHVTALYGDVVSGNLAGAGTDEWTAAQLDRYRDTPLPALLDEFRRVGPLLAAMLDDFPGRYGNQVVGDLTVHEHDVRGALRRPGARDSLAVAVATEFLIEGIVGERTWIVGTDEPATGDSATAIANALASGERHQCRGAAPAGTLTAEPFALFRALTGRRSTAQIRAFDWSVDPAPYLMLFSLWPFAARETDLVE